MPRLSVIVCDITVRASCVGSYADISKQCLVDYFFSYYLFHVGLAVYVCNHCKKQKKIETTINNKKF